MRCIEVRTETSPQSKASEAYDDNLPQSPRNRENHPMWLCSRILACEIGPGDDFSVGSMSQVPPNRGARRHRLLPGAGRRLRGFSLRPLPPPPHAGEELPLGCSLPRPTEVR